MLPIVARAAILFGPRCLTKGAAARRCLGRLQPHRPLSAMDQASSGPAAAVTAGAAGPAAAAPPEPEGGAAPVPPKPKQVAHFCRQCGSRMELTLQHGDNLWRHICTSSSCGYIDYQNPKMVVGCIVEHEGRLLLCRRGIEPQRGLWTVPAGFLEMSESTAEGAARETWEEAGARVEILAPYVHYDIPGISQSYILFRARLAPPFTFNARQPESLEARLFAPHEIPFDQLAFSSVAIALRHYLEDLEGGHFHMHHGVIVKRPGAGPNTPGSFTLQQHFAIPTTLPAPAPSKGQQL